MYDVRSLEMATSYIVSCIDEKGACERYLNMQNLRYGTCLCCALYVRLARRSVYGFSDALVGVCDVKRVVCLRQGTNNLLPPLEGLRGTNINSAAAPHRCAEELRVTVVDGLQIF